MSEKDPSKEEQSSQQHEQLRADDTEVHSIEPHAIPPHSVPTTSVHYGGFWMRLWAFLVDSVLIGVVGSMLTNVALATVGMNENPPTFWLFSLDDVLKAFFFYAYFVLMTKYFQQTLGKMIFGLKVMSTKGEGSLSWGTVLFREWIGRFISGAIMILYVLVAFLPKKQGLHDVFADTTVIHEQTRKVIDQSKLVTT
ncbi:RDD family protein [Bacillus fonticola]|uniref:RDD family protein n=1 Tax=Bacillus fonticola TaxID=2728853 RepID=UPI001D13DF4E|nr:RDD family protein [Bacillus fonticola]